MPTTEAGGQGRLQRLWARLGGLGSRSRHRVQSLRAPAGAGDPAGAGAGWDAPAAARAQQAGRLAAAGVRLHAEEDRLQEERAYGEVDLGAQERHAGQDQAHRAALRRFRTGRQRPAA